MNKVILIIYLFLMFSISNCPAQYQKLNDTLFLYSSGEDSVKIEKLFFGRYRVTKYSKDKVIREISKVTTDKRFDFYKSKYSLSFYPNGQKDDLHKKKLIGSKSIHWNEKGQITGKSRVHGATTTKKFRTKTYTYNEEGNLKKYEFKKYYSGCFHYKSIKNKIITYDENGKVLSKEKK